MTQPTQVDALAAARAALQHLTDPEIPVVSLADLGILREVRAGSDGVPEVLVTAGNGCTSGHIGASVFLFVKNAEGRYTQQLGFPGAGVTPLPTRTRGWQDLRIGTAGFCEPVWAWKGAAYDLHCRVETQRGGCRDLRPVQLCRR